MDEFGKAQKLVGRHCTCKLCWSIGKIQGHANKRRYKHRARHKLKQELEQRIYDDYVSYDWEGDYYEWTRRTYWYPIWEYEGDPIEFARYYLVYGDEVMDVLQDLWDVEWLVETAPKWEESESHRVKMNIRWFQTGRF